jgi:trehalose/maltose hydrolase-like predicted phosphorylase
MIGGYHPEHDHFSGGQVKQADTVMLSFPFGAAMAPAVLANDLSYYTDITSQNGV